MPKVNRIPLGEVAEIIRGVSYDKAEATTQPQKGYLPVLRAGNITNELNTSSDLVFVPERRVSKEQILRVGDIVMCASSGSSEVIGKSAQVKDQWLGSYGAFCVAIRARKCNPQYLQYYLRTKQFKAWSRKSLGANIKNIRKNELRLIEIPLPGAQEQEKIVNSLAKAEAALVKRRKALALADEFLKSTFLDLFGDPVRNTKQWPTATLAELGEVDRGISKHRPRNAPELLNGPYPFVQTGDVTNASGYITEYRHTYSEIGLKQSKMWPAGTLCITIAANIARTATLTFPACFPDSVVGFTPGEKVRAEYVHYFFSFYQKVLEAAAPESAQKNINLRILRELLVPLPPIAKQDVFVALVSMVRTIKTSQRASEQKFEILFAALLHRAFIVP